MTRLLRTATLSACLLGFAAAAHAEDKPPTPEQLAFFESKIRPVLVDNCYRCHSTEAEKHKGGLRLDSRDAIRKGGDTGPAVVPGNPKKSLLLKAIRHEDEKLKMPEDKKLPAAVVADFERWIAMGAPDPRDGKTVAVKAIDVEKGRSYWAFQPPKVVEPRKPVNAAWPRSAIDRYILAALEARGLQPVGDADKRTLIRRVSFDLIGLPPTPEEVEAFVKDASPAAFEKVVDKLLASPHFGERWGRHWLDVARYAESSGKEVNFNYPQAWRYRDYVIKAFNDDKPYDRFIKEQLAGDLLPAADDKRKAEQLIATGFLALGPKSHNERQQLQFAMDVADEQIDAFSQAFLGLTAACARCHDHKFDPIPQKDYYALAGIFRSTETCYGTFRVIQNNHPSALVSLPAGSGQPSALEKVSKDELERFKKEIADLRTERQKILRDGKGFGTREAIINNVRLATVESKLASYDDDGAPKLLAMGVRERFRTQDSPLFGRGEIDKPGEIVPRGVLQVVTKKTPEIRRGSGRLELAEWVASPDNPLTARVMANRVWLHLFGRGLVATPDNFGVMGQPPSHPQLLDYLAVSFCDHGWSVKKLVKQIVMSRAYHLASASDPKCYEADPENALVWRMSPRRLEAEALRDAMLAVSGQLDRRPPRGSPVARIGEGNSQTLLRFGPIDGRATYRSVYLPVVRNQLPDVLSLFDVADPSLVTGERSSTTVPAQGLYLLNNPFVMAQADAAAEKLMTASSERERIQQAYLRFYSRPPTERETKAAEEFIAKYTRAKEKDRGPILRAERAVWSGFCQALFASAEFLYRN
jgi:cytochrome c553